MPRLFSLDEAIALLPRLEPLLNELRRSVEELAALDGGGAGSIRVRRNGHQNGPAPPARQEVLRQRISRLAEQVTELGVELKDARSGLVDFPSERDGQVVYLCWRLGEPGIAYWHPLDSGFAGRQPL